jgi:sialate O-acetylesterase
VFLSTNVPIGIVTSDYGGTFVQQWTSNAVIQSNPVWAAYYTSRSSSAYYNGMLYPLHNLSIKGFIWYQGESNRADTPPANYTNLTSEMVGNWRSIFNQGQLPFYYVQVAPYAQDYFSTNPWGGNPLSDDYAFFREAQTAIKTITPNTGQAITMDVGDIIRIHPRNKRPVGERLAYLALNNTYGQQVQSLGPQYLSWAATSNTATISFVDGTATGLNTVSNAPLNQFFFVAGTDHVFRQATAVISGEQMVVTAPAGTPLPILAVRYAFTDFPITNLQNSAGLPMEAFRTDDWTN